MAGAESPRLCVIGDVTSVHVQKRSEPFSSRGFSVDIIGSALPSGLGGLMTLCRRLRSSQADVFHIHYAASVGAWLWVALGRNDRTMVTVMGGDILDDEQVPLPPLARWMTLQVVLRADLVTAKTEYLSRRLRKLGVEDDRIVRIMWGVDLDVFHRVDPTKIRRVLKLQDHHRVVLSPRLLRPFYNIHVLVEALPAMLAADPNVRLVLTEYRADPDYRKLLAKMAAALAVEHAVVWAGEVAHEDMPALYSAAEVVVAIPPSEGFPHTLLEAMACGTACVVTDIECIREQVVHGETAMLVRPAAGPVADATIRLLKDCELQVRITENGIRLTSAKADQKNEFDKVEVLYRNAGEPRSKRSCAWWYRAAIWIILLGLVGRNKFAGRA